MTPGTARWHGRVATRGTTGAMSLRGHLMPTRSAARPSPLNANQAPAGRPTGRRPQSNTPDNTASNDGRFPGRRLTAEGEEPCRMAGRSGSGSTEW